MQSPAGPRPLQTAPTDSSDVRVTRRAGRPQVGDPAAGSVFTVDWLGANSRLSVSLSTCYFVIHANLSTHASPGGPILAARVQSGSTGVLPTPPHKPGRASGRREGVLANSPAMTMRCRLNQVQAFFCRRTPRGDVEYRAVLNSQWATRQLLGATRCRRVADIRGGRVQGAPPQRSSVELLPFEGAARRVEGSGPSGEDADGVDDVVAVVADPRHREEVALVVVAAAAT